MINIYPLNRIIVFLASLYAFVVILAAHFLGLSAHDSLAAAFKWSTPFGLVLVFFMAFGWRIVWRIVPPLNRWVYPDLNGYWDVTIYFSWGTTNGVTQARAQIKQSMSKMSIELVSNESESSTLMVTPKLDPESGRPVLYYMYKNDPKAGLSSRISAHRGAAELKIDLEALNRLEGNYFTDRGTSGRYVMTKES
jgi:hypothetical protein